MHLPNGIRAGVPENGWTMGAVHKKSKQRIRIREACKRSDHAITEDKSDNPQGWKMLCPIKAC
jgi:hypothetical protein